MKSTLGMERTSLPERLRARLGRGVIEQPALVNVADAGD